MVSGNGSLFISQKNTPAASTPNLQQVTDIGNATTNPVFVGLVAPVTGYRFYSSDTVLYNGTNTTSNYFERLATYDNTAAIINGPAYGAGVALHSMQFNASRNIPQGVSGFGSMYAGISLNFTGAFTINQLPGIGLRAIANLTTQTSINPATTNGFSISNMAAVYAKSIYNISGATGTIFNYYGLLLADPLEEWATGTIIGKYGVYQQGSTVNNYFAGPLLLNIASFGGYQLDVGGAIKTNSYLSFSTGISIGVGVGAKTMVTTAIVIGNQVVGGTVAAGDVLIGLQAGNSLNGSLGNNLLFGREAGGTLINGFKNVVLGSYVGSSAFFSMPTNASYKFLVGSLTGGGGGVLLGGDMINGTFWVNPTTTDVFTPSDSVAFGINARITAIGGSTTYKGFLPPRMTGAQVETIPTPEEGLLVYVTDGTGVIVTSKGWWGYEGATWVKLN